jgi:biopolymer transport protein ExbD
MAISGLPGEDDDGGIVAEINITPLCDIFLVLLIIFMVTTTAAQDETKNVQLPTATESSGDESTSVFVSMTVEGKLKVNDFLVTEGELELMLQEALDESDDKVVVLRGDKRIALGSAVEILDLAQRLGAKSVAIATEQPEG